MKGWQRAADVSAKRGSGGFTLMEMIISVGVIGVTASLASSGFSAAASRRAADYDTDFLTAELRAQRMEAMRMGQTIRLTPSAGASRVYTLKYESDPAADRATCATKAFASVLKTKTWKPKSLYRFYALAPQGICFFPDGSASGGAFYLTQRKALPPEEAGEALSGLKETDVLRTSDIAISAAGPRASVEIPAATGVPDVVRDFSGMLEARAKQESEEPNEEITEQIDQEEDVQAND